MKPKHTGKPAVSIAPLDARDLRPDAAPASTAPTTPGLSRRRAILGAGALLSCASSGLLAGCSNERGNGNAIPERGAADAKAATSPEGGHYDGILAVRGNVLVNGVGQTIQLRGANIQNQSGAMITGSADASGGTSGGNDQPNGPNPALLKTWRMNAIRIGINEASWLGYESYTTTGIKIAPGPAEGPKSYRAQITAEIAALNAIGCYVILVLGWSNPGRSAPLGQDVMANQDNSIPCWQSIAATYGYPHGTALKKNGGIVDDRSVLFELFNEPFAYGGDGDGWGYTMNGGFFPHHYDVSTSGKYGQQYGHVFPFPCDVPSGEFVPGEHVVIGDGITGQVLCYFRNSTSGFESSGTQFVHLYNLSSTAIARGAIITGSTSGARTTTTGATWGWFLAGMAQMLSAIRGTGAWNPCLIGGLKYCNDLSQWARYAPSDASAPAGYDGPRWLPQVAAAWHPYPAVSSINTVSIARGGTGYNVGDTILLPMPEEGPYANSVYWQAQLEVLSVSGTSVSEVRIRSYAGGTPGHAGGDNSQYYRRKMIGGVYSNLLLPANPVPQAGSSGKGSGALFNLNFSISTAAAGRIIPNGPRWSPCRRHRACRS